MAVGYGEPLKHHDRVHVLGQHRVTDILGQPLVQSVGPLPFVVLGRLGLKFFKDSLNKLTPAMAAGITDTLWSLENIAERIEAARPQPGKRGPYKKRIAT